MANFDPAGMKKVIGGKRYDVDKATLVASDRYWDGHNWERSGRNTFLYKTGKGNFFLVRMTMWQGERDYIEPISQEEALEYWDHLPEHEVTYREAYGVEPEEA